MYYLYPCFNFPCTIYILVLILHEPSVSFFNFPCTICILVLIHHVQYISFVGSNILLDIILLVINNFRFIDSCSTHVSLASVFVCHAKCKVVPLRNTERILEPPECFHRAPWDSFIFTSPLHGY